MDKIKRFWAICIDAKQQILVPYGSKLHIQPPNYHLLTVQQTQYYQNKLKVKYLRIFWRSHEQKDETERARGPGKKRKKERRQQRRVKWWPWHTRQGLTSDFPGLQEATAEACLPNGQRWVPVCVCIYIHIYKPLDEARAKPTSSLSSGVLISLNLSNHFIISEEIGAATFQCNIVTRAILVVS